jgi:D-lactate dehydrogenase
MKIAFFDTHRFEKGVFESENTRHQHRITFLETRLTAISAGLAAGHDCACLFVSDKASREALQVLKKSGVRLLALRSAGFNHVDLGAARELGLTVVRVPEYSPYAVAEHAMAMIQTLNRKIHRAYHRVREGDFSLDGLVGFDLHEKTVGIIGTGRIGAVFARIAAGFQCRVLAYDLSPNPVLSDGQIRGVTYVGLEDIFKECDIISLHVPLTPKTYHLVNETTLKLTKRGVMIVNTSRGALVDTKALIQSLKSGHIGSAALDVYEEEEGIFFENLSDQILGDDQLARLMTFPNVLITAHQAFLTHEALHNIASTTLTNISDFEAGRPLTNTVTA